jgi:hypothetical protein
MKFKNDSFNLFKKNLMVLLNINLKVLYIFEVDSDELHSYMSRIIRDLYQPTYSKFD